MKSVSGISNSNFNNRTKQVLLLAVLIIIGVLISQAASAQHNFHKSKRVNHKIVYKVQVHKSDKVCNILNKKRHYVDKPGLFASNRKPKTKGQAEVD